MSAFKRSKFTHLLAVNRCLFIVNNFWRHTLGPRKQLSILLFIDDAVSIPGLPLASNDDYEVKTLTKTQIGIQTEHRRNHDLKVGGQTSSSLPTSFSLPSPLLSSHPLQLFLLLSFPPLPFL